MKKLTTVLLTVTLAMGMPMLAVAMDHSAHGMDKTEGMKQGQDMKMDHAKDMSHDMHKGHNMTAESDEFVEIGKDTQDGVVATVKVKTYDEKTLEKMSKMGMDATHHVMVFFADEKTGADVVNGQVAVKVKGGDAKPVMMMLMGTGFGGDLKLGDGMYTFEIGTKLEDGKKRQFSVMFHNM